MPSHVSHAENFLEAAHCVSQTGWKNATSFRIYIWVLRLQMMQSLQSTSTQSSRGLSKVSAYWVANLYRTKPAVLLNITTLWERDIVDKTLHSDLDSLINTFASKHGRSNYFLSITFLWPLVLPSSQRTVADQCQEVGQLVGMVLSLLHRHGHYQKHLSSYHKLSPLLLLHKFNHWHNQACSRFNTTSPFTRICWDCSSWHSAGLFSLKQPCAKY